MTELLSTTNILESCWINSLHVTVPSSIIRAFALYKFISSMNDGAISQVKKVNGVEVENLKHLRQIVEDCSRESIRFDLDDERVIALNYDAANVATSRILKRHRIPCAMSADLIEEQNVSQIELTSSS